MSKEILITGGLGYLGSQAVLMAYDFGYRPVILDNCSNSSKDVLHTIASIIGKENIIFYEADLRNYEELNKIFNEHNILAILHFAALKSVIDSNIQKELYFQNNFIGSKNLIDIASTYNVNKIIFSSTAAVYESCKFAVTEDDFVNPSSYYGITKLEVEKYLLKIFETKKISVGILRYFNPIGSHESGLLGENILTKNKSLFFILMEQYFLNNKNIKIFGNTYDTNDGTCIRDYLNVSDLIKAHFDLLEFININPGFHKFNVGTGIGTSVLEFIESFSDIANFKFKITFVEKRDFESFFSLANVNKFKTIFGWTPRLSIKKSFLNSYEYFRNNLKK